MKILLDECVPSPMQSQLGNHVCATVQDRGWSGVRNGDLLQRAEAEFDLFITSDQNIRYQQNLLERRNAGRISGWPLRARSLTTARRTSMFGCSSIARISGWTSPALDIRKSSEKAS